MPLDITEDDGSEDAVGILWGAVDTTDEDQKVAVHVRDCEVLGAELVYPTGATTNEKAAINVQLAALHIIVR